MSDELTNLFAQRFIARPDVKAIQHSDGSWSPHTENRKRDGVRIPWRREDLDHHIAGSQTFGHYLLSAESHCKLFAFDIDLEKTGWLPNEDETDFEQIGEPTDRSDESLRKVWLNRAHPGRTWMKLQFKQIAHMLLNTIHTELELPCAVAYSGGKGVHVYAFTGLIPAKDAREGAQIVLDLLPFKAVRGENFWKHTNQDPIKGYPNISIETFPKQNSLDGKDLGNLMRLPLGRNLKSQDPTFFVDMTSPIGQMVPIDPVWALTTDNPWKRPGE